MANRKHHTGHTQHVLALLTATLAASIAATSSTAAAATCSNQAVREQQNAEYLPDCRGYERVSPAQKGGGEVEHAPNGGGDSFQAAAHGAAVAYEADGAFPGSPSSSLLGDIYLSHSDSLGSSWQTLPLTPSGALNTNPENAARDVGGFAYYSSDLNCGVLHTELPLTAVPAGESAEEYKSNLYVWNAATSGYALVTDAKLEDAGPPTVDGASADCSHVIFESEEYESLAPGTDNALFEWDGGTPQVASVLPDGTLAEEPINENKGRSDLNDISSDGSRVFFTAESDEDEEYDEVFMRVDGTETIRVSAPEPGSEKYKAEESEATFESASESGERVFFLAEYGRAAGASSSSSATECEPEKLGKGCDLYEYDTSTKSLTDISADPNSADAEGADVMGVLGISAEGEVVYFSARGQLVAGEGRSEEENEDEETANVYVDDRGQLSYVANVGAEEAGVAEGEGRGLDALVDSGSGSRFTASRVSVDGQYLLFATSRPLRQSDGVTYDNTDAATGKADYEDYEYSLATSEVTCVSCDPSGAQPQLREGVTGPFSEEYGEYQDNGGGELRRNLASDGAVFFQTTNPVLPQAVNDTVNVYEWEPAGVGSCPAGEARGCTSILDSGSDPGPSYFVGASEDGENVYLTTYAKLAPEDTDGLRDMYDVRLDGGFLQTATKECTGEECQGAVPAPESQLTPGSTLSGANGNVETITREVEATKAAKATLTILSKKVSGSTVRLKVKVSGAGKVMLTGAKVRKGVKSAKASGKLTLIAKLTKAAAAKLAKGVKVKAKLTVSFKPTGATKIAKKVSVKFKP